MSIRTTIITLILLVVTMVAAKAQCVEQNRTTRPGEWAHYNAYYNWHFIWMNAADVYFNTQAMGDDLLLLESTGKTKSGYDWFFTVRDTFQSVVERATLRPRLFKQSNFEGKTVTTSQYEYNATEETLTAYTTQKKGNKKGNKTSYNGKWDLCAADVLTMVYKARNIDFENCQPGDTIPMSLIINSEIFDLFIRYHGKEQASTRDGRTYDCLKFTPLLVEGTIFSGGEDMTVWVTDDENRVPIVVEAQVLIGSVKAILDEVKGTQSPLKEVEKR
ncbi:MAG: DUF3108 domain-containing protein [Bacteroidia bacterium]|nr:DUF3108 domain-containing protein [Bacteroidia bacterium]